MLQSLHSLQQENQRLQDQILGLTAKKDRLQLLNTELAVPFPPHFLLHQGSMHTSAQINFLSSTQGQKHHRLLPVLAREQRMAAFASFISANLKAAVDVCVFC